MTVTEQPGERQQPDDRPPSARGWHHYPADPPEITRWFTGRSWTNQVTGGSAEQRARATVVAAPPLQRSIPPLPPTGDPVAVLPSVASTILVALFFGPFGIVPAAVNSAVAGYAGRPTAKYWTAFVLTEAVVAVVTLVVLFVVP